MVTVLWSSRDKLCRPFFNRNLNEDFRVDLRINTCPEAIARRRNLATIFFFLELGHCYVPPRIGDADQAHCQRVGSQLIRRMRLSELSLYSCFRCSVAECSSSNVCCLETDGVTRIHRQPTVVHQVISSDACGTSGCVGDRRFGYGRRSSSHRSVDGRSSSRHR